MFNFKSAKWDHVDNLAPRSFLCWNCGEKIASEKAYVTKDDHGRYFSFIYICFNCNAPIIIGDEKREVLLPLPGKEINKLPENIKGIYSEIRKSMQSGCFNGAIMLMRTLIMHIAVEEGAPERKTFAEYIDYMCDNVLVPIKSRNKADSVRTIGNSAVHEIETRTQQEAQNCFEFIGLLLEVNYGFADEEEATEDSTTSS